MFVVRPSVSMVTSPFISTVWCSRPYKSYIFWKLIIWWMVMTMTETKTYKKTNTKTKAQTQTQKKYKVLPRPNVCYIFEKQGYQKLHFLPKFSTQNFPTKFSTEHFSPKKISQTNFHNNILQNQFSTCLLMAWIFEFRTVNLVYFKILIDFRNN